VNFNIVQFELVFMHIKQVLMKIFFECECHMLISSFLLNLDIIT
jgi:hypothetical protein